MFMFRITLKRALCGPYEYTVRGTAINLAAFLESFRFDAEDIVTIEVQTPS